MVNGIRTAMEDCSAFRVGLARESASSRGTSQPVTLCRTSSGTGPISDAITGRLHAIDASPRNRVLYPRSLEGHTNGGLSRSRRSNCGLCSDSLTSIIIRYSFRRTGTTWQLLHPNYRGCPVVHGQLGWFNLGVTCFDKRRSVLLSGPIE